MVDKKKILGLPIGLAILLMVSAIGLAAWVIFVNDHSSVTVFSSNVNPVSITQSFSNPDLNVQNSSAEVTDTMIVTNTDGNFTATMTINISKTDDYLDSCNDYLDDCDVSTTWNGISVIDQEEVLVVSGENTLLSTVSCVKWACNQEIESIITIQ